MPELEVEGAGTFDVDEDRRLVLAIKDDAGVNIMHSCEGFARCSTCRVEFLEGDPEDMTQAELRMLEMRDLVGEARLSCQIVCEHDMKVRVLAAMTVAREFQGSPPLLATLADASVDVRLTPPDGVRLHRDALAL